MAGKQPIPIVRPPWRPRFGIGGMLLIMSALSVTAAAGFYLEKALHGGRKAQFIFILFTLVAPIVIAIITSWIREFAIHFLPKHPPTADSNRSDK